MIDSEIVKKYGYKTLTENDYIKLDKIMNSDYYKKKITNIKNGKESMHSIKGMLDLEIKKLEHKLLAYKIN